MCTMVRCPDAAALFCSSKHDVADMRTTQEDARWLFMYHFLAVFAFTFGSFGKEKSFRAGDIVVEAHLLGEELAPDTWERCSILWQKLNHKVPKLRWSPACRPAV
mmetsp:Transcript_69238/g.109261  ORF Transcript_69238/g.109261 Transcript_69238/m.109261 type:complete len:105 (-) Transcript_69238:66-380(-)